MVVKTPQIISTSMDKPPPGVALTLTAMITLTIGILMAAMLVSALNTGRQSLDTITEVEYPRKTAAREMANRALGIRLGCVSYLLSGERRFREQVGQYRSDFIRFLAQYRHLANSEQAKIADQIGGLYQKYSALTELLMQKRMGGKSGAFDTGDFHRFLALGSEMDDLLDEARLRAAADVEEATRRAKEAYIDLISTLGLGTPLLILSALAGVWLAWRRVMGPTERLCAAMQALGEGDLDRRIDAQDRRELGALAVSFNEMAARLEARISHLARARGRSPSDALTVEESDRPSQQVPWHRGLRQHRER